jgi:hypothetical protein
MAVRDPHSPAPAMLTAGEGVEELEVRDDPRERAAQLLRPHEGDPDPASLRRHMDACVALAVHAGLCRGRALEAHAAVTEAWDSDLRRADEELASSLRCLLGIDPSTRQEH